ncbi:hypothetical protein ACRARG_04775 [Pseudooceanicola sp. C21-150M6]|uniref:hypothetical protein n=1 Tax=Pseudooceanicola sp. C21-150M6 TaxID=3434355 RepID=UPI003D7FB97F
MGAPINIATDATMRDIANRLARMEEQLRRLSPPEEWQTVQKAAEAHGVSTATVNRWVRDGRWKAKGCGKMRRVRPC